MISIKNIIKQFIPPIFLKSAKTTQFFIQSFKSNKNKRYKTVKIGDKEILIPLDHKLDSYMTSYPRYDKALGEIARIMHEHLGHFTAIDIGANVGDSAALICKYHNIPVLCIEGCSEFMPYLKLNATKIGTHIQIANCFVGTQSGFIDNKLMNVKNGTASMPNYFSDETDKKHALNNIKTLAEILLQNKSFENAALIKIDTDGYDFSIILHSLNYFKKNMPILFLEYDPSYNGNNEAESAMNALWNIGYRHFLIYDNFGNFLIALHDTNSFCDINAYLAANRKTKQVIYYFDVCAISHEKFEVFEKIRNYELYNFN
ncbi:MAG: FkbM family methyltransferase [Candidatus Babeliales bacterium]|jgi:FkbM family methyltransferase